MPGRVRPSGVVNRWDGCSTRTPFGLALALNAEIESPNEAVEVVFSSFGIAFPIATYTGQIARLYKAIIKSTIGPSSPGRYTGQEGVQPCNRQVAEVFIRSTVGGNPEAGESGSVSTT